MFRTLIKSTKPFMSKTFVQGAVTKMDKKLKSPIPGVFHSFASVMDVLNEHSHLDEVKKLIAVYDAAKEEADSVPQEKSRKPLIVFEGIDGCGKSRMTREVAVNVDAVLLGTPPQALQPLREAFDSRGEALRRAYYAVGNYIAASQARLYSATRPVVMDRFWHSTGVYAMANAARTEGADLPAADDAVYSWPSDLLRPDAVLFLSVSEDVRARRLSGRAAFTPEEDRLKANEDFRNKVITAYGLMRNPSITVLDGNLSVQDSLKNILKTIEPLFK